MKIKKKLKKYGKGGEILEKKKIEDSFVDANNFLKNWQQSPMYNEMLNNSSTGEEYSKISNYRNKSLNLNPVDNLNVEKTLLHNPNTTGFVRKGIPVVNISSDWHNNNEMLSNLKTESDSLKVRLGEIPDYKIPTNFVTPSTIVHEMSHITDWKGLPKTDLQKIKNFSSDRDKNKFSNYVANPSETRSRLNEIRYENSLLKYYNPLTEKINKDQYNNYLKDKSKGNALNDLKNVYSDDEIIDMLNSISENKSPQEQIPMAKNGGNIITENVQLPETQQSLTPKLTKFGDGGNLKNAYSITADALSLFPPTSVAGYVMGLPTTAYDMYQDYQKGDNKQLALDAMGLIPAFKLMKYSKFAKSATQGINMASKFNKAVDVANMANDVNQTIEKKEFGGNITTENNMKTKIKKGKKLPKALNGKKQYGDLETIYNQQEIQLLPERTDFGQIGNFNKIGGSEMDNPQINLGNTQPNFYDFNTGEYPEQDYSIPSNQKRPQEQTYQMESLQPQLLPQNNQLPTSLTPITQNQYTPKTNVNWNNSFPGITGLGGNTFLSKGISQLGSGLTNIGKGTLDMFGNMKKNNREEYRNAKQFQQSVYSDAENRPQGQIYGKDIRGGNALFADGGMNIKEIGGQGEPNVEIEGKEHVLLPNGMSQTVQGDSHAEGGIPLNLAPGSMIFSEKLKDPTTGKSYAKLAKPFETKKDVERKDNKRGDVIQKNTADFAIKFKEDKLKGLFEQQEQNKLSGKHGKKVQMEAIQSLQQEQQPEQEQPIAKYGMKLPKAGNGWNTAWTSKILEHERKSGAPGGKPFTSGYDEKDWSNGRFEKEYVEKVRKEIPNFDALPDDIKQKLVDYKFNTGRNTKDLVSFATGKINLNEINSLATPDRFNSDLLNTPNLSQKLNHAKEDVYMTTHKNDPNFQENFDKNWFPRIKMWDDKTSKNTFNTGYNPNVIDPRINNTNPVINTPQLPVGGGENGFYSGNLTEIPIKNRSYSTPESQEALSSFNVAPNYGYTNKPEDLQAAKSRYISLMRDAKVLTPELANKIQEAKNFQELNPLAGALQNYDYAAHPQISEHYGKNVPATRKGIQYLLDKKLINAKDFPGLIDKKGAIIGSMKDFKDKKYADKLQTIVQGAEPEIQNSYARANFVDNEAYYRAPEIKDIKFKTQAEKQAYLEGNKSNIYDDAVYSGTEGLYLRPTAPNEDPMVKQPTSDPVAPTDYKFTNKAKQQDFDMPNINMGIPLPYNEKTTPLNYYKIQPEFIDPRYLNVQPQLNDITRGVRTVQNNLGDRSTASVGNSLQAQINAYGQENQVYGNKYNYDKGQDSQAQQFNAQAKMNTDQYNQNSWYNQLEDPIRARSSAKNKQFKENQQRGLENWNEQMAFNNNSNYINDTFYNPRNIDNINWGANLNPVDVKKAKESKWNDEIEKEQYIKQKKAELGLAKNGGKVRIKPKIKLK